jgi:hypothetical protein
MKALVLLKLLIQNYTALCTSSNSIVSANLLLIIIKFTIENPINIWRLEATAPAVPVVATPLILQGFLEQY